MTTSVRALLSRLRPRDDHLPEEMRSQVQVHRLLSLLGAGLVVGFAPLYAVAAPDAIDPLWVRVGIAGLFLTLLTASYRSARVRAAYVSCVWGVLYLIVGWFVVLAALNQFSGEYAVGLLLVYAVLAGIVAFGAESVWASLAFLGYGGGGTVLATLTGPRPETSPLILLASMGTIAVVETVLTQGWLWIRKTVREQEARLQGLTNSLPGVVFQFFVREDGTVGHHFVSEHAEDVLGLEADPPTFHERCLERIPDPYQREIERSIETAIDEQSDWEFETPFDPPDGERIWALGASTPEQREGETVFNGVILDITERKEAERRRRTYEELKDSAEDAIVIADADGDIIDWNPGAEAMFGYEKEAIVGRPIETIMPDRHRAPHRRGMERVRETGRGRFLGETVELEGLHQDGHEVPVELALSSWEADRERFFGAIIRDITERKNAEQALREERDRFETLFESLPTPVVRCVAQDDGVFVTDANPAFEDTFGLAATEAVGAEINHMLVPEKDHDRARDFDRRVLESGEVRAEVQRTTAEGMREFQVQAISRRPDEGPPEIYAIYTDITERKRRERRLNAIFNHTYQFTGLMEPDGTMIEANDTALRFGGLDREDIVGTPIWKTHWAQTGEDSKQRLREAVERAAEGEFVRYERPIQGGDEDRIIDFSIRPVTDADGQVELLIPEARDITELKRREETLRAAKEEAEEASRLKSAVLANMSHELRTPLTSILGFAEAIDDEASDGAGPVSRFASLIAKSGERLLRTFDNILNLSRLEAEQQNEPAEPVDVAAAARSVADEIRDQAEADDIALRTEVGSATMRTRAPADQVPIVLRHLLSNAITYTEAGGTVWLRVGRAGGDVVVEVEDTGIGMDPEEVPALFEPFRQASEGFGREYEGTGLGLAVVQRAVDRMGGTVDVATEEGEGTCVTVGLPGMEPTNDAPSLGEG
ncbi:PAS domain S-box protein [Salinibacter ruber]|uniref:PAS domain S-box protein n=1 Tax=Salinibacter ruber TaxID=146919 RepID=UPI00216997EB|nr:PAS domain S-box protein [Salinibacter ruber]MCS4195852.1 PAS domain S-box-containing protein [Salinibacter ruber]